jgi:hypothetical protein
MRGQRPTFRNGDAQGQRQAVSKLFGDDRHRERRAAIYEQVFGTTGSLTALPPSEYYRAASCMGLYEQPSQPLPLLSAGVPDTPTTLSPLTEPAAGQWQGPGLPIVPPSGAGIPGSPPDPGPIQEASALSAVGSLTVAETAALSGVAAQSGVGAFSADATTRRPPTPL